MDNGCFLVVQEFPSFLYAAKCQLKHISWEQVLMEVFFPQLWISKKGSRDLRGHDCHCGEIDGVISA